MADLIMYDGITKDVQLMPAYGDIYAGYDDGSFNDVDAIVARFPDKPVVSIDVTGANQAQALDVENGDATVADIDPWLATKGLAGPVFDRPIIYMSVDVARASFPSAHPNGCLLWSAHYTMQAHICGPSSCGTLPYDADMTQWGSFPDYDESLVSSVHYVWKGNPVTTPTPPVIQYHWGYCDQCGSLYYVPNQATSVCAGVPEFVVNADGSLKVTFGNHNTQGNSRNLGVGILPGNP